MYFQVSNTSKQKLLHLSANVIDKAFICIKRLSPLFRRALNHNVGIQSVLKMKSLPWRRGLVVTPPPAAEEI
jgi:hypothetical protein